MVFDREPPIRDDEEYRMADSPRFTDEFSTGCLSTNMFQHGIAKHDIKIIVIKWKALTRLDFDVRNAWIFFQQFPPISEASTYDLAPPWVTLLQHVGLRSLLVGYANV
jgi:hypothetical protein